MSILLTILVTVSALFGCLTAYLLDKEKHKRAFRIIVITTGILTLSIIWGNHFRQEKESKSTQERFDRIIEQNDSLKAQIDEISEELEPFMQIAKASYPALGNEEAITKLATDISKKLALMQPKIVYLSEKTKSWKDNKTNLIHTVYSLRSQYPITVRDISIKMGFDRTILRAKGKITGVFVQEEGSRMMVDADSKGLTFVTGLLRGDNDIRIEVITNEPPKITSMKISP